jgi:hypothetical protein
MVGREELKAVREEDLDDRKVISRIRNASRGTFISLSEVRQRQSNFRAENIARKRSKKPASSSISLEDSQPSHGTPALSVPC